MNTQRQRPVHPARNCLGLAGPALALCLLPAAAPGQLTTLERYGNAAGPQSFFVADDPANGDYTITANGTDIWGGSDNGVFLHSGQTTAGDFTAVVRVVSVSPFRNEWGRSGLIARADLDANGANAGHIRKSNNNNANSQGTVLQYRDTKGGGYSRVDPGIMGTQGLVTTPVETVAIWLSFSRDGDRFLSSWAFDDGGQPGEWSLTDEHAVSAALSGPLYVGLGHHSHGDPNEGSPDDANTAVFTHFSVGPLDLSVHRIVGFETDVRFDPDGNVLARAFLLVNGEPQGDPLDIEVEITEEPTELTDPPQPVAGVLVEHYAFNNPGNGAALDNHFANNQPVIPPFREERIAWSGNETSLAADGVQKYYDAINRHYNNPGDLNSYSVRITGEIYFQESGRYQFKDGVDDYCRLIIGDTTVIDDNTWTNTVGTANNGSPISPFTITVGEDGEWRPFEFIMAEGGGGDHGLLAWDYAPGSILQGSGIGRLIGRGFPTSNTEPIGGSAIVPSWAFRSPAMSTADLAEQVTAVSHLGTTLGSPGVNEAVLDDAGAPLNVVMAPDKYYTINLTATTQDGLFSTFATRSTRPTFDFEAGFEVDGATGVVSARAFVTDREVPTDLPVEYTLTVTRHAISFPAPGTVAGGVLYEWYGGGNPGNIAALRTNWEAGPVVDPFVWDNIGWGGDGAHLFTADGVPSYPPPLEAELGVVANRDQYSVRIEGELLIPEDGTYQFKDGVDDFCYLEIDNEVLINDNTWAGEDGVRADGTNPSPIVSKTFAGIEAGGRWVPFEFAMAEGGGGDAGTLFWDYDLFGNEGSRLGANPGFPATDGDPAAATALIPREAFRTEATQPGHLKTTFAVVRGTAPFGDLGTNVPIGLTLPVADDDFFYTLDFTAQAGDPDLFLDPVTDSIDLNPVQDSNVTTSEDNPVNGNVLGANPGGLSVVSFDASRVAGDFNLNPDGSFTYDPAGRFEEMDLGESILEQVTFRTEDGPLGARGGMLAITVNGVADPPVIVDDAFAISHQGSLVIDMNALLLNDSDIDSDSFVVADFATGGNLLGTLTPLPSPGGALGRFFSLGGSQGTPAQLEPTAGPIALEALNPVVEQIVRRIDFGVGTENQPGDGSVLDRGGTSGNPFGGIGVSVTNDDHAGLFTGFVEVGVTGDYVFTNRSDDGGRIWVDADQSGTFEAGELVVDDNTNHGMRNRNGAVSLTPGLYPFRAAFYERGGGSGYQMSWEMTGGFGRQIIPPDRLWHPRNNRVFEYDTAGAYDHLAPGETAEVMIPYTLADPSSGELVTGQVVITVTNGELPDTDEDGLDSQGELVAGTDPNNPDTDGDGLLDGEEVNTHGTDPRVADTDGDGLNDKEEIDAGSSPFLPDTDGDGSPDLFEVTNGTDPNDANEKPSLQRSGGTFTVTHAWSAGDLISGEAQARALIAGQIEAQAEITVELPFLNFQEDVAPPLFLDTVQEYPLWLGQGFNLAFDDFALAASGFFLLERGGTVSFVVNSDDGFNLIIDGVSVGSVGNRGRANSVVAVDLSAGGHTFDFITWERGGGAGAYVLVARGPGRGLPVDEGHYDLLRAVVSPFETVTDDTDGDGMDDYFEEFFFGDLSRDGSGDFNGDGLTDLEEFNNRTHPRIADTDGDGLSDFDEVTVHLTDPNAFDSDGDGIGDFDEVNGDPATNPAKADTDDDTFGDRVELVLGTDPNDAGSNPGANVSILVRSAGAGEDWNTAEIWSDGQAPAAGREYIVLGSIASTLNSASGDFGGDSLWLTDGAELHLTHPADTSARVDLILQDSALFNAPGIDAPENRGLGGSLEIRKDSTINPGGGTVEISGPLSGAGDLRVEDTSGAFNVVGAVRLTGEGGSFSGDWTVSFTEVAGEADGSVGPGSIHLIDGVMDVFHNIDAPGSVITVEGDIYRFPLRGNHTYQDLIIPDPSNTAVLISLVERLPDVGIPVPIVFDGDLAIGLTVDPNFPDLGGTITLVGDSTPADSDGDGISDEDEAAVGTDPNDPNSIFQVRTRPDVVIGAGGAIESFSFTVPGGAGVTFNVEYKASLSDPTWTLVGTLAGGATFTDVDPGRLARATGVYRVVLPPAPAP